MHELPLLRMSLILTAIKRNHIKLSAKMQMKLEVLNIYIKDYYENHNQKTPPQCICTTPSQAYPEKE